MSPAGLNWKLERTADGFNVRFPGSIVYAFDTNGALQCESDAWGNAISLSYADDETFGGLLTRVQHSNGQGLDLTYEFGRLTRVSAATNLSVSFFFDDFGDITNATRHTSEGDFSNLYSYDTYVTQRVNPLGETSNYGYVTNAYGQPLSKCSELALEANYYAHKVEYNSANLTTVRYTRGDTNQVFQYVYNQPGAPISEIRGPVSTNGGASPKTTFSYDSATNLTGITISGVDPTEYVTTLRSYDQSHNIISNSFGYCAAPTQAWGYAWHPVYDTLTLTTDPEGHRTEIEYTNASISRIRVFPGATDSLETIFAHTPGGLLSSVTNANAHWAQFGYDPYGRLASVTPQLGPGTTFSNNILGHLVKISLPGESAPRVTTFDPDELGRVRSVTYPDGLSETFQFDAIGNLTNSVDRAGRTNFFTYLPSRKPSASVRRLSNGFAITNRVEYDNQFNTLTIRDAKDRKVEAYALDIQDRPITVTNLEGQTLSVNYGVGDFVKSITRFDGTIVSNSYNSDGLLAATHYPDATHAFTYYRNGALKTAGNAGGTLTNMFDMAGRLTNATQAVPGGGSLYTYWPAGQVSNAVTVAGTTTYSLDAADRLSGIRNPVSSIKFQFNPNNGLASRVTNETSGIYAEYSFDLLDRLTNIVWRKSDGTVLKSFAYSVNPVGLITNVLLETGTSISYSYDDLDRLTREKRGTEYDISMSFDQVGNRTNMTSGGITQTFNYQAGNNRLASWGVSGENTLTTDSAGCITSLACSGQPTRTLSWNGQYQVTSIASNAVTVESYGYDALGRRSYIAQGTTTNWLVYDGDHVVAEVNGSGQLQKSYTWGPGIDNLLAMTVYSGSITNTYYALTDHLGTVHAFANSTGSIVESYKFDAWGRVLGVFNSSGIQIPGSSIQNRFLWQGREYSWKTGLYNFRARWYDPITGRWLSNDPIGISGGLNQYVFCANNPVNFVDPLGLDEWAETIVRAVVEAIGLLDTLPIGSILPGVGQWGDIGAFASAQGVLTVDVGTGNIGLGQYFGASSLNFLNLVVGTAGNATPAIGNITLSIVELGLMSSSAAIVSEEEGLSAFNPAPNLGKIIEAAMSNYPHDELPCKKKLQVPNNGQPTPPSPKPVGQP